MDREATEVLLVTHDLKEAAYLASRICVMQARARAHRRRQRGAVRQAAHHRNFLRAGIRFTYAAASRTHRGRTCRPEVMS